MRKLLILALSIGCAYSLGAQSSQLALRLGPSHFNILDYENSFVGLALDAEFVLNRKFSLDAKIGNHRGGGIDVNEYKAGVRFHTGTALQGFFVRSGIAWAACDIPEEQRLNSPFDDDATNPYNFGILELGIGFSAIVYEHLSMSLYVNLGGTPTFLSPTSSMGFGVGYAF